VDGIGDEIVVLAAQQIGLEIEADVFTAARLVKVMGDKNFHGF